MCFTELSISDNSTLKMRIIQSGKYAKFTIKGHMISIFLEKFNKKNVDRGDYNESKNS